MNKFEKKNAEYKKKNRTRKRVGEDTADDDCPLGGASVRQLWSGGDKWVDQSVDWIYERELLLCD